MTQATQNLGYFKTWVLEGKFIKLFRGQKGVCQIAWLISILNLETLSDLPIKEKVPLNHCTNLDPSLIFFLNIFYWQITKRFAVQDQNEPSNLANPFLTPEKLYEVAFSKYLQQIKNWQNLVYMVDEWPTNKVNYSICPDFFLSILIYVLKIV